MIDRDLITRKLALIAADLKALAPLAAKSVDEYLRSEIDEVLVERYLERIVGRMIDVNYTSSPNPGIRRPRTITSRSPSCRSSAFYQRRSQRRSLPVPDSGTGSSTSTTTLTQSACTKRQPLQSATSPSTRSTCGDF